MPTDTNGDRISDNTILRRTFAPQPWYAKTIHVAVVMAIACFFMWANASNFDSTEGKALLGMLLVLIVYAFGGDGVKALSGLVSNVLGRNGSQSKS